MFGCPGMPATAATRPPPTEGPRLRNLKLIDSAAAAAAAGAGAAAPRRGRWAASGAAIMEAMSREYCARRTLTTGMAGTPGAVVGIRRIILRAATNDAIGQV